MGNEKQESIEKYIEGLGARSISELLEECGQELPLMLDMSSTLDVVFEKAVAHFSPKSCDKPSLEHIEALDVHEIMCLINLQEILLRNLTKHVVIQNELIKRISCRYPEKES